MHSLIAAVLGCLILITVEGDAHRIPKSLSIGCATSAYQAEGAWNVSDKGVSYWDNVVHTHPDYIADRSNGDVACDFYHRYKEDVEYVSDIGFDHFRFSLAWSRLLPRGTPDYVSQDGVRFYHRLLDELEARNITPVVTLYHWDHPHVLETEGGWLKEKIVDRFGEYVRFVFKEFGSRVKTFVTINEPNTFCELVYGPGRQFGPDIIKTRQEYTCMHNLLKAHARAYHIYDKEFRSQQKGSLGLVTMCDYYYAKPGTDPNAEEVAFQFQCGWMAHPIFSNQGDYPEVMKKRIAEMSKFQGLKESKLPEFSKDWVEYIKGTADYYGLNHYSSSLVTQQPTSNRRDWLNDEGLMYERYYGDSTINKTVVMKHRKISRSKVPQGLISIMRKIYKEYGRIPIFIMENGVTDANGTEDNLRIDYHYDYMVAMLDAVKKYGIDLRGYTIWSLTDNWQWYSGYTERFGLIAVDFDSDLLKRTPKKSAKWMKSVLKNRKLEARNPSAIALKARLGITF